MKKVDLGGAPQKNKYNMLYQKGALSAARFCMTVFKHLVTHLV